jgi:hypothetical protein
MKTAALIVVALIALLSVPCFAETELTCRDIPENAVSFNSTSPVILYLGNMDKGFILVGKFTNLNEKELVAIRETKLIPIICWKVEMDR